MSDDLAAPSDAPAQELLRDIREQPDALRALAGRASEYETVAREARLRKLTTVRLVAHGSSDNAASFAVYAFGIEARWTAFRDSISLHIYYGAEVDLGDSFVVALSQSGETPDVVEYVERARARGAFTVAVTNEPESSLAEAAEAALPLVGVRERAIPATKTYTGQVAALALLAAFAGGSGQAMVDGVHEAAGQLAASLPELEERVSELAPSLAPVNRMFTIGRGPEYATAREIALKLLETCRVAAEALTATDLVHGPVAALDSSFPVWAIASRDASLGAVQAAVARARSAGGAVIASGSAAVDLADATHRIPVPAASVPLLGPLLSVVPGQLLAWALAREKGLDPDRPAGITKVTRTP